MWRDFIACRRRQKYERDLGGYGIIGFTIKHFDLKMANKINVNIYLQDVNFKTSFLSVHNWFAAKVVRHLWLELDEWHVLRTETLIAHPFCVNLLCEEVKCGFCQTSAHTMKPKVAPGLTENCLIVVIHFFMTNSTRVDRWCWRILRVKDHRLTCNQQFKTIFTATDSCGTIRMLDVTDKIALIKLSNSCKGSQCPLEPLTINSCSSRLIWNKRTDFLNFILVIR